MASNSPNKSPLNPPALSSSHDHQLGSPSNASSSTSAKRPASSSSSSSQPATYAQKPKRRRSSLLHDHSFDTSDFTTTSSSKHVATFLSKHSAKSYNPNSGPPSLASKMLANKPTYCNRHRPEAKCWRQADEPTMEELQNNLNKLDQEDQQGISHVWAAFSAAPAKQRQLMLQGILSVCCFPQLSYVSAQVREMIKIDFISALPVELSFKVLSFLDTVSLCKAAQVSRRWNFLAEDDVVWHKMCEQHIAKKCKKCGWGLPLLDRKRLEKEKKVIAQRARGLSVNQPEQDQTEQDCTVNQGLTDHPSPGTKRFLEEPDDIQPAKKQRIENTTEEGKQPWKEVYKTRFKVGTNWKYGRYQLRILKGHENGVMCLQFRDNTLATGSYDGTIKIWDLDSGEEVRTLQGHTSGIRCIQFYKNQLISGGMDSTIRFWNIETGELLRTLEGPAGDVLSVNFEAPYLVSGGKDNIVRVWNFKTKGACALRGHKDFVNSVRIHGPSRTVFSGADDNTVRLWDLDSGKVIRTFEGHVGGVQQVHLLPPEFELDESDLLDCEHPSDTDDHHDTKSSQESQEESQEEGVCFRPAPRLNREAKSPTPAPDHLPNPPLFPADINRANPPVYILTASLDSTMRLWHVPTGRCLRTYFGHIEGLWAIACDNLRIVSGSEDRTVKVWDPKTGKCERTFTGHAGPVTCIGLSGDRIVTGSEDCEIRVMDFSPKEEEEEAPTPKAVSA